MSKRLIQFVFLVYFSILHPSLSFSMEEMVTATFGWNTENLKINGFKRLNIIYDYDKSDILSESKKVLDSVYVFMQCHPYAVFYIENHTDSRGNDKYNSHLTLRRAKMCVEYLISRGIAPDRLIAYGMGEEELIYSDKYIKENAKTKPEQELLHQVNRRTVLKVKSLDYVPAINTDILNNTTFLESDDASIRFLVGEKAEAVQLSRFEKSFLNWLFTQYITDEFQNQNRYYIIYKDDECRYKVLLLMMQDELLNGILSQLDSIKRFRYSACSHIWEKQK